MRIAIDIPDDQLAELSRIAKCEKVSRAALVRQAIADLLAASRRTGDPEIDAAFGLWADRDEDGLAYQERLRSEWDGRDER
jgi:metal-responsive CopG/Arc/MetJ family transcriptional regulator